MSWGSTSYTPIVTRNEPPFGFAESQNPPDFPVSVINPYIATDYLKQRIEDLTNSSGDLRSGPHFQCGDPNNDMDGCFAELKDQTYGLREQFSLLPSSGLTYFLMMLILTIVSGVFSNKVAFGVSGKVFPVEKALNSIPFINRLPQKILNNKKLLGRFVTKVNPLGDLVFNIVMPIMVMLTIWMSNTLTLQVAIYQKCGKVNLDTFKVSMTSALAGAIPCAVLTIVLSVVIFILNRIPMFTPFISIAGVMGGLTIAYVSVLLGTNFIFGSAAGLTSAQANGCAAPAPPAVPA
jgi:hypothetical protein